MCHQVVYSKHSLTSIREIFPLISKLQNSIKLSHSIAKALNLRRILAWNGLKRYCLKSIPIWSFLVRIFPHSDWLRSHMRYLSVFSRNAEKHGPEIFLIRTYFTQCTLLTKFMYVKYTTFFWISSQGAYFKIGLSEWVPIQGGHLFKKS